MLNNIFLLTRPLNVIIAGLSVFIAATLSPQFTFSIDLLLAILSTACITAAANIINDIFDIEIDRLNQPNRILPSGKLSLEIARRSYYFFNLTGLILASLVNISLLVIAVFAVICLYFYSSVYKRKILIGNFVVSLLSGIAFIYGAHSVGDWQAGVIPAIFSFLFHFGREIVKDMQDIEGDLAHSAITFAGRYGVVKSTLLVNIIFGILIVFLFVPYLINFYNLYYIYIVVPGVVFFLLAVSISLWKRSDSVWLEKISVALKIDMFIGLIAIYIGAQS